MPRFTTMCTLMRIIIMVTKSVISSITSFISVDSKLPKTLK